MGRTEDWLDESELVSAAKAGDRAAFDELVRRTFVDTFTLARRLTGNEEDGRDVAQDAYLRAWRGIGKFRGEAAFSTWMYRITANAAATNVRRRRRQQADPFEDDLEPADPRTDLQPAAMAESAEALERITDALDELPPKRPRKALVGRCSRAAASRTPVRSVGPRSRPAPPPRC